MTSFVLSPQARPEQTFWIKTTLKAGRAIRAGAVGCSPGIGQWVPGHGSPFGS